MKAHIGKKIVKAQIKIVEAITNYLVEIHDAIPGEPYDNKPLIKPPQNEEEESYE